VEAAVDHAVLMISDLVRASTPAGPR
jgi:hypothetical protein